VETELLRLPHLVRLQQNLLRFLSDAGNQFEGDGARRGKGAGIDSISSIELGVGSGVGWERVGTGCAAGSTKCGTTGAGSDACCDYACCG
jgi:hypothetical protein